MVQELLKLSIEEIKKRNEKMIKEQVKGNKSYGK